MLLRCSRCLSRFAHDLLHCPQCGVEADGNSSPDPDVVGTPEPAPAAEPVVPAVEEDTAATTSAGRRRAAKDPAPDPEPAAPEPEPADAPPAELPAEPPAETEPAPAAGFEYKPTPEPATPDATDATA